MTFLNNKVKRDKLKPGDHIYTYRYAYIYAHHGIYVADTKVIHFVATKSPGPGASTSGFSSLSVSSKTPGTGTKCSKCGFEKLNTKCAVVSTCLDCFLKGGSICRFKYGVKRRLLFTRARGGTCSKDPADPLDLTIYRAEYLLSTGFGDYDLGTRNCEHFASYCKKGLVMVLEGDDDDQSLTADRIQNIGGNFGQLYSGILTFPVWSPLLDATGILDLMNMLAGVKGIKVEVEQLASIFKWDISASKKLPYRRLTFDDNSLRCTGNKNLSSNEGEVIGKDIADGSEYSEDDAVSNEIDESNEEDNIPLLTMNPN